MLWGHSQGRHGVYRGWLGFHRGSKKALFGGKGKLSMESSLSQGLLLRLEVACLFGLKSQPRSVNPVLGI